MTLSAQPQYATRIDVVKGKHFCFSTCEQMTSLVWGMKLSKTFQNLSYINHILHIHVWGFFKFNFVDEHPSQGCKSRMLVYGNHVGLSHPKVDLRFIIISGGFQLETISFSNMKVLIDYLGCLNTIFNSYFSELWLFLKFSIHHGGLKWTPLYLHCSLHSPKFPCNDTRKEHCIISSLVDYVVNHQLSKTTGYL